MASEEPDINQTEDEIHPVDKLKHALHAGIWLSLFAAGGRLLLFFRQENYSQHEISCFASNYLQAGVNQVLLPGLGLAVLLGLVWLVFHRMEGLLLAGFVSAIPILPIVVFLNKNYLPGRFHPVSLVGNSLLLLAAGGLTLWLFLRWCKDFQLMSRLYNRWSLTAACVVVLAVNLAHLLQPTERRFQAAPADPSALSALFKPALLSKIAAENGTPALYGDRTKKHFSEVGNHRLKLLEDRIARKDTADIMAEADAAIERTFHLLNVSHTFQDEITWRQNPTRDREWLLALNRMDWIWSVAVAYKFTGDPKYATAFDEIMRSWFRQNPMPRWKNEKDNVWRLIESSARMTDGWIEAFFIFYNCDQVSDEVKWRMLASFHDHAQFLAHFRSPRRNHLLQETYGLLAVGAAFPEFKMADKWIEIARLRLDRAMHEDVYPDGGYTEGSTYYHRFAIRILQEITDFSTAYGVQISDYFYAQLEKMYSFLMHTARPDGVMPQMNDGFHAKNLRLLFDTPAEFFSRQDFEFFASAGQRGRAADATSVAYPYSGVYVMRSDWSPEARYLLVDAGPFGSSHGHEDKLSFEVFAFGEPFIVDSGTYTYVHNKWRRFFTSSFAHNTIVVDGRSQIRFPSAEHWVNAPPETLGNKWISTELFDYLEARYEEGYGSVKEDILGGIVHTRRWLFVKPDYWILWDVITGTGEHELEQFFHFWHEVEVELEDAGKVRAVSRKGPILLLESFGPKLDEVTVFKGDEEPVQGWVSPEYGVKMAAPAVKYKRAGELPLAFVTGLFAFPGSSDSLDSELLPVEWNGQLVATTSAIALKVQTPSSTDLILIAPGLDGQKCLGRMTTVSQLMILRSRRDGSEKSDARLRI
ncbi:MAG: alginate lyase family protein [bacterium]